MTGHRARIVEHILDPVVFRGSAQVWNSQPLHELTNRGETLPHDGVCTRVLCETVEVHLQSIGGLSIRGVLCGYANVYSRADVCGVTLGVS